MAKKKDCPFCGGRYKDTLPACPYCGTLNYKGAEAQYLGKLENVRTNMEDLGSLPERETKKEFKKQFIFVIIIFAVLIGVVVLLGSFFYLLDREEPRDYQADYLWQQQNYPIFTEAYESGDYEKLVEMYREAVEQDCPIDDWEHEDFVGVLDDMQTCIECIEALEQGEVLSDYDYITLVYYGFKMDGPYLKEHLTEDELEKVQPYVDVVLEDFYSRWEFTEKQKMKIIEDRDSHYGYPEWDYVRDYIKQWKKENKK